MSILDLYKKNADRVGVTNPATYEQKIFKMETAGINDLVEKDLMDPTFRPPIPQDTYLATLFKDGVESIQL